MAGQPYEETSESSDPGLGGTPIKRADELDETRAMPRLVPWGVATLPSNMTDTQADAIEKIGSDKSFVLTRLVAEGGVGEVWQALQTSLDRVVAVKRIQEKHYDRLKAAGQRADLLDRQFQQEAVITAHLEHPNIVPVYDLGADPEGRPLLAMKLVRGTPWDLLIDADFKQLVMDDYLARHLPILIAMSQAVAFAHSKRIIHRDLKPSQVMVGEFGEVLLMDWGLAIMMDASQIDNRPIIRDTHRIPTPATATSPAGTPSMMAPEQTLESAVGISPLTDIYLLGGTLYYLLTGQYPHEAASTELSIEHARSVDVVVPQEDYMGRPIARELAAIAEHALRRDPSARPQDIEHFIAQVRDYISGSNRRQESVQLVDQAAVLLHDFEKSAGGSSSTRFSTADSYHDLTKCVGLIDRALVCWPGNPDIPALRGRALELYANTALRQGDLVLARVVADRIDDERSREKVLQKISRREEMIALEKRQRKLGIAAACILAIAFLAGAMQYSFSMSRKNSELEAQRDMLERASITARDAERIAISETEQANVARLAAEREQYFSAILIAADAAREGRVGKALDVLLNNSPAAFRNWEWGHLLATIQPEDVRFNGNSEYYHGAFLEGNEQIMLSSNGRIRTYDRNTGRLIRSMPAGIQVVWSFDISPDGEYLAAASFDSRIFVIRLSDGEAVQTYVTGEYQRVARFSPDGSRLLTGGADNRFRVYDMETGALILESPNMNDHVYSAAWSPDGKRFAIAIRRAGTIIFDAETGELIHTLQGIGVTDNTLGLRWTRDNKYIVTATADNIARLFDAETYELLKSFDNVTSWLHDADLSPDQTLLATVDDAGAARIFSVETGQVLATVHTLGPLFKVSFSPDGKELLAVASREARLLNVERMLDQSSRRVAQSPREAMELPHMRIYGVPTYRDRAWGNSESIWNVPTGTSIVDSASGSFFVQSRYTVLSPDGEWMAKIDPYQGGSTIYNATNMNIVAAIGDERMIDVDVRADGSAVALAETRHNIHIVDPQRWAIVRTLTPPPNAPDQPQDPYHISQVRFSPDGKTLAAAYMASGVILWDVETGEILHHWKPAATRDAVGLCLAFSPDGRMLASGGSQSHILIWDVKSGELISTLIGHGRTVMKIAFSHDSSRVVTCSRDLSARLWEASTGREVMVLYDGPETPVAATFDHDGTSVALAMASGASRVLTAFPTNLVPPDINPSMPLEDLYEMWKRASRNGVDITPADLHDNQGTEVVASRSE